MIQRFLSAVIGSAVMTISGIAAAQAAGGAPAGVTADTGANQLEEIVVTATKRPERGRGISCSVSSYDQAALESLVAESFADYLTRTPGVVFNASVPGNSP